MNSVNSKFNVMSTDPISSAFFSFMNIGIKIDDFSSSYFGHTISSNAFANVGFAVYLSGSKYDKISLNLFNPLEGSPALNGFGVLAFSSSNLDIVDNKLSRYAVGMYIINSGQTQTSLVGYDGDGGNIFTRCGLPFRTMLNNDMLDVRCNTFDNKPNTYYGGLTWNIFNGTFKDQGLFSTDEKDQAGNLFNIDEPGVNNEIDANTTSPFWYYHHGVPVTTPTAVPGATFTEVGNGIPFTTLDNACVDPCLGGGLPCKIPLIGSYKASITTLESEHAAVLANLDGGDTPGKLAAVNSNLNSAQLKNTLLGSFKLSDEVLLAYINKPIGGGNSAVTPGHFLQVIMANSPVSDQVAPPLQNKLPDLPDGIANQIRTAQANNQQRTLTAIEREIIHVTGQKQLQVNRAVREMVNSGDEASAIQLLEAENDKEVDQTLVAVYIEKKDYATATAKLNSLPLVSAEDIAFHDLNETYISLFSSGKTLWELDAAQEQLVRDIAAQCPETLPVRNARAVLSVVYGEEIPDCPQPQLKTAGINVSESPGGVWGVMGTTEALKEMVAEGVSALGKNVPNPHTGTTYIPYSLTPGVEGAYLRVSDVTGRVMKVLPVYGETPHVELSLEGFESGVYYYSLVIENETLQTQRMVLIQ